MSKKMAKKTATKKDAPRKRASKPKKTEAQVELGSAEAPQVTDAQIRARAYEIYRRGANPSDPTADWLQAVQELRAETGT